MSTENENSNEKSEINPVQESAENKSQQPEVASVTNGRESGAMLSRFKKSSWLLFYFFVGITLFFISALLVFMLRQHQPEKFVMMDLIGKNYIDVHNELITSQLRVTVTPRYYNDLPSGVVLAQSIPAGSITRARRRLSVVVNKHAPMLEMPALNGNTLQTARATLSRLTVDEAVYSLEISVISRIYSDLPRDIILAQFPPPGAKVALNSKVYLLVSAGKIRKNAEEGLRRYLTPSQMVNQNIDVLISYFNLKKQEYRIREIREPDPGSVEGNVYKVKVDRRGVYNLSVYHRQRSVRFLSGYERLELDLRGESCRVALKELATEAGIEPTATERGVTDTASVNKSGDERLLLNTQKAEAGEKITLLFYRNGPSEVVTSCGGEVINRKRLVADDFS